jgi:hypothetical protein
MLPIMSSAWGSASPHLEDFDAHRVGGKLLGAALPVVPEDVVPEFVGQQREAAGVAVPHLELNARVECSGWSGCTGPWSYR